MKHLTPPETKDGDHEEVEAVGAERTARGEVRGIDLPYGRYAGNELGQGRSGRKEDDACPDAAEPRLISNGVAESDEKPSAEEDQKRCAEILTPGFEQPVFTLSRT